MLSFRFRLPELLEGPLLALFWSWHPKRRMWGATGVCPCRPKTPLLALQYIKDSEQGFLVQTAQPTASVSPRSYPAQPGVARCSPLASRYSSGAICFLGMMKNRYSMKSCWGQGGKESSISLSVWKDKQE